MHPTLPDSYDLPALKNRLQSNPVFGRPLFFFDSIDSTNSFLRRLPPEQNRHGAVAVADHQSAGRGKYERHWRDTPGRSLLFSLLLEATRPARFQSLITLSAGVSVCRTLEKAGLAQARIRWPNDVLYSGKKVCGILTESGSAPPFLVVGMGLNVHQSPQDFPPPLRESAASLGMIDPHPWNRAELLAAILEDFARVFELWKSEKDDRILDECRRRLSALGCAVRLSGRDRTAEGVVMDLDRDGSLVVRESTGVVSRWHTANVEEQGEAKTMNDER